MERAQKVENEHRMGVKVCILAQRMIDWSRFLPLNRKDKKRIYLSRAWTEER